MHELRPELRRTIKMFYKIEVRDHIRVPADKFGNDVQSAVLSEIKGKFDGYISKELGFVIDVSKINEIGEGVIIPGDGAAYYRTRFELLCFKPELQEVIEGKIKDIADFGAFMNLGATEGMIHVSQSMDDFVSYSKDKVLQGKETGRTLKLGDLCRARIIAVSFKDVQSPKIGLTMRQNYLGKLEWIEDEKLGKPKKAKEAKK